MSRSSWVIIGCFVVTLLTALVSLAVADGLHGGRAKAQRPQSVPRSEPDAAPEPAPPRSWRYALDSLTGPAVLVVVQYVAFLAVVVFFMVMAYRIAHGVESQAAATARLAAAAEEELARSPAVVPPG